MTLLVLASDGPMLFEWDEQAAAYMEPVDVRNGEYRVFDTSGRIRPLTIAVGTGGTLGFSRIPVETVQIGTGEDLSEPRTAALKSIAEYLQRVHGLTIETRSFPEVVELLRKHEGYTR